MQAKAACHEWESAFSFLMEKRTPVFIGIGYWKKKVISSGNFPDELPSSVIIVGVFI